MDNNGRTPLMIAAQGNQPAVCSQLLQRGAKVDLVDKEGKTALILACENGSVESAELLLQNEANVGLVDRMGHDALHYATLSKNRTLKRLVRNALKKWKKRELGIEHSSGAGSQAPSESGKETEASSLPPTSERGDGSEGEEDEEDEDPELKEWRSRYREEKARVIQLELQLAHKAKECDALSEGRQAVRERLWEQVQEIHRLVPEGQEGGRDWQELSRRYGCDATEEDYYLNLLAEQVQALKRGRQEEQRRRTEEQKKRSEETRQAATAPQPAQRLEPPAAEAPGEAIRWPGQEEEEERTWQRLELERLQAELSAALEEKAGAAKRVLEMEGHMENMRAVIGVYEAKKKTQSGALKELEVRLEELGQENQRLRGLLAKHLGECEKKGEQERAAVSWFLAEMEQEYAKVWRQNLEAARENEALKQEAEEVLRSKLQYQAVPSGAVKRSIAAWKKVVTRLECALAGVEKVSFTVLEKAGPLREAVVASPSRVTVNGNGYHEEQNGVPGDKRALPAGNSEALGEVQKTVPGESQPQEADVGQVKLRPKPDVSENKARPCRKSSDLEKEVWDLKQNNGVLVKELAQLSREREKLQVELRSLCGPKEKSPEEEEEEKEASGRLVVELEQTVSSLSQELLAEKEETQKLRLRLEAQTKEMVAVRDTFLKEMAKEATTLGTENLDTCILKELHWKLDNVVRKQNEALQLVSEMEEETQAREAEQMVLANHRSLDAFAVNKKGQREDPLEASDAIGDIWKVRQHMKELERGFQELRELLEATCLGERSQEVTKVKHLLGRLDTKMAELGREQEEALEKQEKVRGMLSLRVQALGQELADLREKYEEVSGEFAHDKEVLASERQKNEELVAEYEEEVEELRGKSQVLEGAKEKLSKKVEELSRACQDREAKIKKLLKETEKLSSEVLNLRSERARLRLQNEVVQKNHQEIVSIYRTHLLNAAQGFMDEEVHEMLLRILRTHEV
uniref:Ankyrin repeat domain 35 n=1 Tax=Salvator merianae TaxID=96440 RepID=A0A8D0CCD8_SALMN